MRIQKPSTEERVIKSVHYPLTNKLGEDEIFDEENLPRDDLIKNHFIREGRLDEYAALKIIRDITEILLSEDNLIEIAGPLTICGNIHGQFYDLLKLFEVGGHPGETKYVFLGNYINGGQFGLECLLYLWALKLRYPTKICLLRGNHESRCLSDTFREECHLKYSEVVYEACLQTFEYLPLAAVVDGKYLCLQGGLSSEIRRLDELKSLNRFCEPPSGGPVFDLLWSRPRKDFGDEKDKELFIPNSERTSNRYSYAACCEFLQNNGLLSIISGYEPMDTGYKIYKKSSTSCFPTLISIFSAPNFSDIYRNDGAIISYCKDLINVRVFNASPHPFWLPNFMNGFTWSLPFIGEKVTEMIIQVVDSCLENIDIEETRRQSKMCPAAINKVEQIIELKGGAEKKLKIFSTLRQENEALLDLIKLVSTLPTEMIPRLHYWQKRFPWVNKPNCSIESKAPDIDNEKKHPKQIYLQSHLDRMSL